MDKILLDSFCSFIFERQLIWHRRFVLGKPAPWTDNTILQKYHFTNIYRELDHGTQVLRKHLDAHTTDDPAIRVFNVLYYRVLNNADTWNNIVGGWVSNRLEAEESAHRVLLAFNQGKSPFAKTWQLSPGTPQRTLNGVMTWNPYVITEAARSSRTLQPILTLLKNGKNYPMLTKFSGYQAALDLPYIFPHLRCADADVRVTFTKNGEQNDTHWRGSGAALCQIFGITQSYKTAKMMQQQDWIKLLIQVRDQIPQVQPLWHSVAPIEQPLPALYNVEHSLCEWSKYERLRNKITKGRRLFRPRSTA